MKELQKNIYHIDHCLVAHKVALMRKKTTSPKEFREYASEVATLMGYEALRDLTLYDKRIETPLETTTQKMVKYDSVVFAPILRAGLGMVDGLLSLLPTAAVGHIGLYRDHDTYEAKEYYFKMPELKDKTVLVLDPMLATGGSAIAAIDMLKKLEPQKIKLLVLVAAPFGINAVVTKHPDIELYTAAVDRELNKTNYIVPGLGDAGDRLFGTK